MSEEKILKVSDLPEQEQKEILQQAYAAGLKGTFNGWKVETLKQKIKEAQTPVADEQKETEPSAEPEKEGNTENGEIEEQSTEQENQTDLDPEILRDAEGAIQAVRISAIKGDGVDYLRQAILEKSREIKEKKKSVPRELEDWESEERQ